MAPRRPAERREARRARKPREARKARKARKAREAREENGRSENHVPCLHNSDDKRRFALSLLLKKSA